MKIKKLDLWSFGKFHKKSLDLKEGINVIYGPNESGKSTIHQFILGMFYGFNKYWTKSHSYRQEQDLYAPWYGQQYAGAIEFEDGGLVYRAERDFNKKQEDLKLFNLTENSKVDHVDLYQGSRTPNMGNYFLGMNEKLFREVYFIPQLALEQKDIETNNLLNFFYQVNYQQSNSQLGAFQKAIREKIDSYGTEGQSRSILGSKIKEIQDLEDLENKLKLSLYQDYGKRDEFEKLKREEEEVREAIQDLEKQLRILEHQEEGPGRARRMYEIKLTYLKKKEEAEGYQTQLGRLRQAEDRYRERDRAVVRQVGLLKGLPLVFALAFLALFLGQGVLSKKVMMLVGCFLVFLGLGSYLLGHFLQTRLEDYYGIPYSQIRQDLVKNRPGKDKELEKIKRAYSACLEEMEFLENQYPYLIEEGGLVMENSKLREATRLNRQVMDRMDERTRLLGKIKDYEHIFQDEERKMQRLQESVEKRQRLEEDVADIRKDIGALKKIQEKLQDLLSQRQRVDQDQVFERASSYLNHLTQGRYVRIQGLAEKVEVQMKDGPTIPYKYLSQGGKDQVFLATRLAMADCLNTGMFIALDDSFNHFDQDRLALAWDLLADLSQRHQIIYFTSRREEIPNLPCHKIYLGGVDE